jgi:uncharacterized protein
MKKKCIIKPSRFNILVREKNDNIILFNSYTNALIEIDKQIFEELQLLNTSHRFAVEYYNDSSIEKILNDLLKGNFIQYEQFDEMKSLRYLYNFSRFKANSINLTIIPTYDCNLSCTYCYQEKSNKQYMDKAVQDAIINYIKNRVKDNANKLFIEWYGGEPLLCLNQISEISAKVLEIVRETKITYKADMITNGLLLSEKNIKTLIDNNICSIQITVDGPPEIHDKKRKFKNGDSTFWQILNNIKLASKYLTIDLRINIDNENLNSIIELLDILCEFDLNQENVNPYLGFIKPTTQACKDIAPICVSEIEFINCNLLFIEELSKRGFKNFQYPHPCFHVCGAVTEGVYSIDPIGNIYKCWEVLGLQEEAVGNILDSECKIEHHINFINWMNYDPLKKVKCRNCNIFPICFGGCPSFYVKHPSKKIYNNFPNCSPYKYEKYLSKIMQIAVDKFERGDFDQKKEVNNNCIDQKETIIK